MTPRPHPVRTAGAAAVLAGVLLGTAAPPAQAAPWSAGATRTVTVDLARLGSTLVLVAGVGSVGTDGTTYSMTSAVTTRTGYVDLVNTSTTAVTVTATVAVGTVVGATPVTACSTAWNTAAGTCPGTTAPVALTAVLGSSTGPFASATVVSPGDAAHLQVRLGGVVSTVTATTTAPLPRPGQDRTTT